VDIAALIFALSVCQGQYLFPSSTDFGDLSFFYLAKRQAVFVGSSRGSQRREGEEMGSLSS